MDASEREEAEPVVGYETLASPSESVHDSKRSDIELQDKKFDIPVERKKTDPKTGVNRPLIDKKLAMQAVDDSGARKWYGLMNYVYFWAWYNVFMVILVILGSHYFIVVKGTFWSTCKLHNTGSISWWCVIITHMYEMPVNIWFLYFSYYSLMKLEYQTREYFYSLLQFQIMLFILYTVFQWSLLLGSLVREAPTIENVLFTIEFTFYTIGCCWGYYMTYHLLKPLVFDKSYSIGGVPKADDGYYHPSSEFEIASMVKEVRRRAMTFKNPRFIRARGAGHSFPHDITGISLNPGLGVTDSRNFCAQFCQCCQCYQKNCLDCCANWVPATWFECACCKCCEMKKGAHEAPLDDTVAAIYLDKMRAITQWKPSEDGEYCDVTVEAGCNLSIDPNDFTATSTVENGLLKQLQDKKWALPDLGGITHQTVGGFLATGSSGGSWQVGLIDCIQDYTYVDGHGCIRRVSRNEPSQKDEFDAFGVSMGLFGILTHVTFRCRKTFDIIGQETIWNIKECQLIDTRPWVGGPEVKGPDGKTPPSVTEFLEQNTYSRLMWWPQKGVERLVIWQANIMTKEEYEKQHITGPPMPPSARKPYNELYAPADLFDIVGVSGSLLLQSATDVEEYDETKGKTTPVLAEIYVSALNNLFVNIKNSPQPFQDWWWTGLPMDNQMSDYYFPTVFTELWVDKKDTLRVLKLLNDYFIKEGWNGTGIFSYELYGAKKCDAWLSPSYGEDAFRVDVFWYARAQNTFTTQPVAFYSQFWELLYENNITFRPHWGKYLDLTDNGAIEREKAYPKMKKWKEMRERRDPQNIFLTPYWRQALGIDLSPVDVYSH